MTTQRHPVLGRAGLGAILAVVMAAPVSAGTDLASQGVTVAAAPQTGVVAAGTRYEEPPDPSAPGATATEEDLNEGTDPVVPARPDGAPGGGLGQPSVILPPGAQEQVSPRDLVFLDMPALPSDTASSTAEPQVARHGDRLLVTWNFGAAQSWDGGTTWSYLDPFTFFPSADDGFCCDQLVAWVPDHDLWVWVLQFLRSPGPEGQNRVRIAVAHGDEAFDEGVFTYWDHSAQDLGMPAGDWLDQPKLGWTDEALFLSANGYLPKEPDGEGTFQESVVLRIPIDEMIAGNVTGARYFSTRDYPDRDEEPLFAPYPIRGSGDAMILAAHVDQSTLGIWRWDDRTLELSYRAVTSRTEDGRPLLYPGGTERHRCPTIGAEDPEASDWCAFADPRITAGWRVGGRVGYAWNVPQGQGWTTDFPWVFATEIDLGRLDACEDGGCVVGYPSLWIPDQAVQYAAIAPNSRGDLGGAVLAGGGAYPLSCYGLARDADASPDAGWDMVLVAASDADSPKPRSGDYLGVAPFGTNDQTWTVACMTLAAAGDSTATEVHVAAIGRRQDRAE